MKKRLKTVSSEKAAMTRWHKTNNEKRLKNVSYEKEMVMIHKTSNKKTGKCFIWKIIWCKSSNMSKNVLSRKTMTVRLNKTCNEIIML